MKKFIVAFAFLILLTSCNESKIAYVNVEDVMKEYSGAIQAEEEMRTKSEQISREFDQLAAQFQGKVQEYQSTMGSLSATVKAQKEQELMQEQQMIQQRQQAVQQQFQQEGAEMIEAINAEIGDYIKEFAKKNSYSFILGTSDQTRSVLYGDETLNITDDIIESLNSKSESASKTEDSAVVKDSLTTK